MKDFKLSPKAEELLARLEAREAKARAHKKEQSAEVEDAEKNDVIGGLGPNPLDLC